MRTCVCEGVSKSWLRDSSYTFHFVPDDNIVLLALKIQLNGGSEEIQVDFVINSNPLLILAVGLSKPSSVPSSRHYLHRHHLPSRLQHEQQQEYQCCK